MKAILVLAIVLLFAPVQAAVFISSGTNQTQVNISTGTYVFVEEFDCNEHTCPACPACAACPSCPVLPPVLPAAVSTGVVVGPLPYWRPSAASTNCYRFKGLNENGSPFPAKGDWVPCP